MSLRYFTAKDGARLAYRDSGEGIPLLCLPGLTRDSRDFDYLVPHLPDHRFIRPDYRGRGGSAWTGAATYTVPQETQDVLELLDHLKLDRVALLGTSRGGLIGMFLALVAKPRLTGICLNDVGPALHVPGLDRIKDYVGRNPAVTTLDELADRLPRAMPGFANVPASRWAEEAIRHYEEKDGRIIINYDPDLRISFLQAFEGPPADAWPLFDACAGLPLALIRGANSDLLTAETAAEMRRRRPDMIFAEVPDRAHVPFLDEPEALAAITAWLGLVG